MTTGYETEMDAFKALLARAPLGVQNCFDLEERRLQREKLENYLGVASHGETILARFFAGVWRGDDEWDFNLFDAVGILDDKGKRIVMDWIARPVWP